MRQVAEIAAAEREIGRALEQALALYLSSAATRLLGELPRRITAAATAPDLASWPEREHGWLALLEQFLYGVLTTLFSRRFRGTLTITVTVPDSRFLDQFLAQLWPQLRLLPELVFAEVQNEISRSVDAGDPASRTRSRVADLLRIDAPSSRVAAQIATLQATIADPSSTASVRREARARLAALRNKDDRWSRRWWPKVSEIARTLAVSVLNAATSAAGEVMAQAGEQLFKQWWSTQDSKVREAHRRAHGQTRAVEEKFLVGGFAMDFPGDPTAPPDLTTNCRCSVLMLPAAAGQRARRRYESSRLLASGEHDSEGGAGMPTDVTDEPIVDDAATGEPEADKPEVEPVLAAAASATWRGVLAPMGVRSGDNRMLAAPDGEPQYRTLPLPLLYQRATADGHDNSIVVGAIDKVWVQDGMLMGEGRFNTKSAEARDVVQQIQDGFHRWVSVRIDNETREFRYYREGRQLEAFEVAATEDTSGIEAVSVARTWRLMSATLLAEPAFQEAAISVLSADDGAEVLAASGFDTEVFEFPEFEKAHRLQRDDREAYIPLPPGHDSSRLLEQVAARLGNFATPTTEKRKRADKSGAALPGGRYPIENEADLRNAIRAVGRAGGPSGGSDDRNEVRRHIIKRARALGLSKLIPSTWNPDGSLKTDSSSIVAGADRQQAWYELVAGNVPLEPPAEWFENPQLTGPCKIRVTDEGRIYGHIAAWDTEHAAMPGVTPPRAEDRSYGKFHRHPVRCADGTRVKTGPLAGNKHAPVNERSLWAVQRHYDDPNHVLADVVCGEDEHGIWVSGSLRYGVAAWQVMFADRYSFSGDWRNGELQAACLASVPGFHLDGNDEVQALAASAGADVLAELTPLMQLDFDGEVTALVAAGALPPAPSSDVDNALVVRLRFEDDPDAWGRQIGRAMFAGLREAEDEEKALAAQLRAQAEASARVEEFRSRVFASRDAEVRRLRERVLGKVSG
jgi:hypothetical protein